MTQDWKEAKKRFEKTMRERKYPVSVQETVTGTLIMARDKDAAITEISQILAEETDKRAVVKRMQPMIQAQIEAMEK